MNTKVREHILRIVERARQAFYPEQIRDDYDVLQFADDISIVSKELDKVEEYENILGIIVKALTSNSEMIYSRIFEDKAECGWITQEECDKVLATIKNWKSNR